MEKYISPELYDRYKHQVLEMSLAVQNYVGLQHVRETSCLTDAEIAEKLGLPREQVTGIRMIAEMDLMPADTWINSDAEKRRKCRDSFSKR
ncbi:MAG: hypothetical protein Q8P24_15485 [Desulfobacterales bacterium]|nr:hypothetical protein [Desulfobacterales bacterium]